MAASAPLTFYPLMDNVQKWLDTLKTLQENAARFLSVSGDFGTL